MHAIIHEYLLTGEPVGSKVLVKDYIKNISSATVRKEMSVLVQMNIIIGQHISSGRIPTDEAIQWYVDELTKLYQINQEHKEQIESVYSNVRLHFDTLLDKMVGVLASISKSLAIVLAPRSSGISLERIELVAVTDTLVLIIMISDSGVVFQKKIRLKQFVNQEELYKISRYINRHLKGYELTDLHNKNFSFLIEQSPLEHNSNEILLSVVQNLVYDPPDQDIHMEGKSCFYKTIHCMKESEEAEEIVQVLENKTLLKKIINRSIQSNGVNIRVGLPISIGKRVSGLSLLTKNYTVGGKEVGAIGIIGSIRMPYEKLIPTIDYSSMLLSNMLTQQSELNSTDHTNDSLDRLLLGRD